MHFYCAAGATWGECQRPRRSRRCSLVDLVLGTAFERFCDWYLTFSCPKPGPGPHRIGPEILWCVSVLFFLGSLFEQVDGRTVHFSEKSRSKTGTCTGFCRGSDLFSVLAPPIEFGRWHSPQVAPAAPPAPRVHSSKSAFDLLYTYILLFRLSWLCTRGWLQGKIIFLQEIILPLLRNAYFPYII